MQVKMLTLGSFMTNCYIIHGENSKDCAVIDPGSDINTITQAIREDGLTVKAIILTHAHFDHTGALDELRDLTGAPVYVGEGEVYNRKSSDLYAIDPFNPDFNLVKDGDVISIDGLSLEVIETPGHTKGSITLKGDDVLFTGDTLFKDSMGRTDLLGGGELAIYRSLVRLAELPGDYKVFAGHMGPTTLELERKYNYFIHYGRKLLKSLEAQQ